MIHWPYHKFLAVRRAYRLEGIRQRRMMERLKNGDDDDVLEWNADRFTRPS